MGNGESTAKRISMQKTEEGTVQISEEVMKRLKKDKDKEHGSNAQEANNQVMMKDDNLKMLIKDAFEKGKNVGERIAFDQIQEENNQEMADVKKHHEEAMNLTKREIYDLQHKLDEINKEHESQLEENKKLLQIANQKVHTEKQEKEEFQKKLDAKEESLKIEFKRGVEDIENIMRPLQSRTILCQELQNEAIECYKEHKYQPLRCSKIIDEYRKCISQAKLNGMDARS